MPDLRRRTCTCCGKRDDEVGAISWNGNCVKCAIALENENQEGLHYQQGPAYRRWLRGYARWLERELLDDASRSA